MGSPEFAVPSLRALVTAGYEVVSVFTQPDRPAGRGRKLVAPSVKRTALELGIPIEQPENVRRSGAVEAMRARSPDLIVVAAYGQILRPALIDLPGHGCLNVHASLLPRHRGASAIAASILSGDTETGVSIMLIDPGMDTGPVLSRRSIPMSDSDTTASLTDRLSHLGASLLIDTLPGWLAGELQAEPQDNRMATLAPLLTKERSRIAWRKPADEIWREIRAYNPWPLSSTTLDGELVQILEATTAALSERSARSEPGMILSMEVAGGQLAPGQRQRAGFAVQSADDLLIPLTLRRAGRNAVSGAEFARGTRNLLGSHFGS